MKPSKKSKENFPTFLFKRSLLTLAMAMITAMPVMWAQSGSSFGFKGGLNYNGNGDYFEAIGAAAYDPKRNVGFHVGIFGKLGNDLFFKPEVVYTSTTSDYSDGEFKMQKLDAPLLVGIKVFGPLFRVLRQRVF